LPPAYRHHFSVFFFYIYRHLLTLHSFPTRRSSDLGSVAPFLMRSSASVLPDGMLQYSIQLRISCGVPLPTLPARYGSVPIIRHRSEEHTSELQSPYDLVCRLLLEKKKKNKFPHIIR